MRSGRRSLLLFAALAAGVPHTVMTAHAEVALTPLHTFHEVGDSRVNYTYPFQGPAAGDLQGNGQMNVVAAFPDGVVRAFDSALNVLWSQATDGQISSSPTLADLYGNGQLETIVSTRSGSIYVFDPNGNVEPGWPQHSVDGTPATSFPRDFFSGVAVGDLFHDGRKELVASSYDHYLYVWRSDGSWETGFPINLWDTAWDTPALVPSASDPSQLDIVVGSDSSGPAYQEPEPAGGVIWRFRNTGCNVVTGATSCQVPGWPKLIDQTPWSSPAAANNAGTWDVATGTGYYYGAGGPCIDASCGKKVYMWDAAGNAIGTWPEPTTDATFGSPAIGNLGNGQNDVVATDRAGNVYGYNAHGDWLFSPVTLGGTQFSNPVIAPIDASGTNGIWVGTGAYLEALDHTGARIASANFGHFVPGAPVVVNMGSGLDVIDVGAVDASYTRWDLNMYAVPGGPQYSGANSWPTFHGDMQRDGQAQALNAPSVPWGVSAAAGNASAQVSWRAPANPGSTAVSSYTVSVYDKTSSLVGTQTLSGSPPATTVTITGLTNGSPYFFRVSASNGASSNLSIASYSVTPTMPPTPKTNNTTVSSLQYGLPNSDGATWQDLDPTNLAMAFTPSTTGNYLITANADLWTTTTGWNQDLGICVVTGTNTCDSAHVIAWKESGGFGGTYSPNAAFVQQVASLSSGTTYSIKAVWKTNKPGPHVTIWSAAGSPGSFSQSRLSVRALPAATYSASFPYQYVQTNSDGATWQDLSQAGLHTATLTIPAQASDGTAILDGNADLWTSTSGYNQDIGIEVNGGNYNHAIVAWKESGGFGGTFSPNAAFVQTSIPIIHGTSYTVTLQWKANRPGPSRILAGAGSVGNFSPTTVVAIVVPPNNVVRKVTPTAVQLTNRDSDGAAWKAMDEGTFATTLSVPSGSTCLTAIGGNADLWTDTATYNQDIAIFLNGTMVAWKESGGFAGTFSPNAAFVETEQSLSAGDVVTLRWKTNKPSGTTIYAGAGSTKNFSPTTLLVQFLTCS